MLNAFPTSATLWPSSNRACAWAFTSGVSTTADRRRRGAKNPAAPFSRYNFTYRFTVASGTPNVRAISLCRTHVWGAAGDRKAVCKVVSGERGGRILCAASATIRGGADAGSEGPGAGSVGGRPERGRGGEGIEHSAGHVAQGDWGRPSASTG